MRSVASQLAIEAPLISAAFAEDEEPDVLK
jgi:hypothetical protein